MYPSSQKLDKDKQQQQHLFWNSHKKLLKKPKTIVDKAKAQALKEKVANIAAGFSPAKALKASSQTHQFQPGRFHTGSTTQAAGQIGQQGRLPGGGR